MSLPQSSGVSPDDIATAPTDNPSPSTGNGDSELSPEEQERLEKIRAQFDRAPYPRYPLDGKPSALKRHVHCLRTAYHRRYQKLTETKGKRILDVGCGSGFGTLALALANPDTTIVGVDLSAASLDLAQKRIEHHGL
ncbi:MAG: methyltransferase domain-containing protein, partial [Cyanobacteria bacterium P01_H01_bin.130]